MNVERAAVVKILQEELRLRLKFTPRDYCGGNQLKVEIFFGEDLICYDTVTVQPSNDRD